jgi:hypothetical protein
MSSEANIAENQKSNGAVYSQHDRWLVSPDGTGIPSKLCLAAGTSSTLGQDSVIVGEVYRNQYGGIDKDCDSL